MKGSGSLSKGELQGLPARFMTLAIGLYRREHGIDLCAVVSQNRCLATDFRATSQGFVFRAIGASAEGLIAAFCRLDKSLRGRWEKG
jgi:hypothetical protein